MFNLIEVATSLDDVKGGGKTYHWGVDVQRKGPD